MLSLEGLTVLIEQELQSTVGSSPVIAIIMGKYDNKALTLSVGNWSGQVGYLIKSMHELCVHSIYFMS